MYLFYDDDVGYWNSCKDDIQFELDFPFSVACDYWTTKDGREIKLCDMSESHIRNCMCIVTYFLQH